jgi:parallel beta-helix repeat protein
LFETSEGSNWRGAHNIMIDGLTIDGAHLIGSGVAVIRGAHNITIKNCVIRNTGATGIALNGTDYVTVVHNLIYHTGYHQGGSSGISLWYGGNGAPTYGGPTAWYNRARGFHNVIADNSVSGAADNSRYRLDGNGIVVDGAGSIPPVLILNNLVYENAGRGIEINDTHGKIWVVNNTAYADGLDKRIGTGEEPEFSAYYASTVHWVNNLAYGRIDGNRYTDAYLYMNLDSTISWAHNVGFKGSLSGAGGVTGEPTAYRYADPLLTSPPAIPAGQRPWASAPPPQSIGSDLEPRAGSPALHAGVDPANVTGMTGALATDLTRYLTTPTPGSG